MLRFNRRKGVALLVWIILAILFGIGMQFYWNDGTKTTEYFVGYLVEKSLSVDNIFVFTIIFASLKTPKKLQQLALMWGIMIALILRGIMILIGAALIEQFEWIIWVFGAFLLWTGVAMLRSGGHAGEGEPLCSAYHCWAVMMYGLYVPPESG